MEFRTFNGTQIPISDLDEGQAITVTVNNGTAAGAQEDGRVLQPAGAVNVSRCGSVIVQVSAGNTNREAGVYIQLNFTTVEGKTALCPLGGSVLPHHCHVQPGKFFIVSSAKLNTKSKNRNTAGLHE